MTKYAFALLFLASCDGTDADDGLPVAPAGAWTFGGGECRGPFDEPECTERHVERLPPASPDAADCSEHAECPPGAFCGAGQCRVALDETVTLCIEEAQIEGTVWPEDGSPPDTWINVWDLDFYSYDTVVYHSTYAFDSCQPKWRTCVDYPLERAERDFVQVFQSEAEGPGWRYLFSGPLLPDDPQAVETLGRLTGTGCFEVPSAPTRDDADVRVWISVWYP